MATLSRQVKGENLQFESLHGHLKEITSSWSHMLETQITFIQGFDGPNFHN